MRDRKQPEPPQEASSPAWMATLGDLMTNLLTFFVLLFAFSSMEQSKADEIVSGLKGMSITAIPPLDPNAPDEIEEVQEGKFVITKTNYEDEFEGEQQSSEDVVQMTMMFDELYYKIKDHIEDKDLENLLNVEYIDAFTIQLRILDSAFFDSGRATIDNQAKIALDEVCEIIVQYGDLIETIRIEGNADTVPIGKAGYRDNWELSMDRADSVRRYILSVSDIDPSLLVASYYGEYNPIASNDTEEGRAKNRRVDFVIESKLKG